MTRLPHIEAGALGTWLATRIKGIARRAREVVAGKIPPRRVRLSGATMVDVEEIKQRLRFMRAVAAAGWGLHIAQWLVAFVRSVA